MIVIKKNIKRCMVPLCRNTSANCTEKLFFTLPENHNVRVKWYKAVYRNEDEMISKSKNMFCCEDHFDLEKDTRNYIEYSLMNTKLLLKKGVVPHLFIDEVRNVPGSILTDVNKKRNIVSAELIEYQESMKRMKESDSEQCSVNLAQDDFNYKENIPKTSEFGCQVKLSCHKRSVRTQSKPETKNAQCQAGSPLQRDKKIFRAQISTSSDASTSTSDSDFEISF